MSIENCPECGSHTIAWTGRVRTLIHEGACPYRGRVCEHYNYSWHNKQYCGKPAKGRSKEEDLPMCGIHLAAERKRLRNEEQRHSDRQMQEWLLDETRTLMRRIKDELGINSGLYYDWNNSRYTGKIVIDPADLVAILDEEEE